MRSILGICPRLVAFPSARFRQLRCIGPPCIVSSPWRAIVAVWRSPLRSYFLVAAAPARTWLTNRTAVHVVRRRSPRVLTCCVLALDLPSCFPASVSLVSLTYVGGPVFCPAALTLCRRPSSSVLPRWSSLVGLEPGSSAVYPSFHAAAIVLPTHLASPHSPPPAPFVSSCHVRRPASYRLQAVQHGVRWRASDGAVRWLAHIGGIFVLPLPSRRCLVASCCVVM